MMCLASEEIIQRNCSIIILIARPTPITRQEIGSMGTE